MGAGAGGGARAGTLGIPRSRKAARAVGAGVAARGTGVRVGGARGAAEEPGGAKVVGGGAGAAAGAAVAIARGAGARRNQIRNRSWSRSPFRFAR